MLGLLLVLPGTNVAPEIFFSNKVGKNLCVYNQNLRQGDTKGTSYPRTVVTGAQEDGNTHVKFFCNQTQTTGVVARITINLFLNLSMVPVIFIFWLIYCCQINWWVVVRRVQMGVSIWGAVHLHSLDGWALSGADVQAPWHGVLETVWLHCDEAQQHRRTRRGGWGERPPPRL